VHIPQAVTSGDHRRFVRRAHFVGCLQMRRCD
jgi:hypothetical protein